MAKTLLAVPLTAPASSGNYECGQTFTMSENYTLQGTGQAPTVTLYWQYDQGTGTWIDIPTTGTTGLVASAGSQASATVSTTYSRTITCKSGGAYVIRAKAVSSTPTTMYSVNQPTCTVAALPAAPTGFNYSGLTDVYCYYYWTNHYGGPGNVHIYQNGVYAGEFSYTATNMYNDSLSPSTYYDIAICAANTYNAESERVHVTFWTYGVPPAPTGIHVDSKTQNNVVLHWTDVAAHEDDYHMFKNDVDIAQIAADSVAYEFTGLDSNTLYDLAVKAHSNTYGYSSEAQINVTTLIDSIIRLNVGDVMKQVDITALQINIGDVWKAVKGLFVNVGDVWKTILQAGARGYFEGGAKSTIFTIIEALQFSDKSMSTLSAILSEAKYSAQGVSSSLKGYTLGGCCTGTNAWSAVIEALVFASETNGALAAVLSLARASVGGVQSSAKGYAGGGVYGVTPSDTNEIDGIQFSDDTAINPSAVLSAIRDPVGVSSSTKGYFCGGYLQLTPFQSAEIDGILFADETAFNPAAAMSSARADLASLSSSTRGYCIGGRTPVTGEIDGIQFSDDTAINPAAALGVARMVLCGVTYTTVGYVAGGMNASYAYIASIESFTYATEAVASESAVLSDIRYGMIGTQSPEPA